MESIAISTWSMKAHLSMTCLKVMEKLKTIMTSTNYQEISILLTFLISNSKLSIGMETDIKVQLLSKAT